MHVSSWGYSTQSRAYRVFNRRTRVIVESIHVNFDNLPQMASDHVSSDPAPECQRMALEHGSLSPGPHQMFDELLNGSSKVALKSFAVTTADAPNQRQQQNTTPLNNLSTPDPTCQVPTQVPTVASTENMNQTEMVEEYAQVKNDEFINIFCTPIQDRGETSSHHVDSSNMHTFYQHHPSEHRWTKDHPLEQVIGNPSQSVRTRRQLESDDEMCMFVLTVSHTEPKNIKEAMADSAWIESMQEELHQFDRLDEGVDFEESFAHVARLEAVRAWYEELSNFLASKGFSKGSIDPTLFITKHRGDILLVQIYVDDIIFGSTNPNLSKRFEKLMHNKFEMSMMGELKFFLGIQIHQSHRGIFINQSKYAQEILIKHDTIHMGIWYPKDTGFELTAFSDSDHAGYLDSRKSTSGGIQFLDGDKLVNWSSKKQDCTSMSSAEADHSYLVQSSPTFTYQAHRRQIPLHQRKGRKGIVELFFVGTEYQLADLFTNALPKERFKYLVRRLGMRCLTPDELEVLANKYV
nr:hypothetical protein [Tanacetum cinerariifolium]